MQYTYWDVFPTPQNSFWTHRFWCLLELLLFFCFTTFTRQNVSLWGLFSSGKERKKVPGGKIEWIGRVGHGSGVMLFFDQKLNTIMKQPTCWESSKKNSLKPNAASHNNANQYIDTDVFLEYSPSRGSLYYKGPTLQKIILFLGGPPLVNVFHVSDNILS